jgi:branched-chain amino acid transport system ATP-binding protein
MATNLSPPERKRLELARALATQPNLILLDEVMAGLRAKETEEIIRLIQDINRKGITIFVIEHVMKVIMSLSNRIIVLNYGEKIATGTPLEISKDQSVIKAYLGKEYHFA